MKRISVTKVGLQYTDLSGSTFVVCRWKNFLDKQYFMKFSFITNCEYLSITRLMIMKSTVWKNCVHHALLLSFSITWHYFFLITFYHSFVIPNLQKNNYLLRQLLSLNLLQNRCYFGIRKLSLNSFEICLYSISFLLSVRKILRYFPCTFIICYFLLAVISVSDFLCVLSWNIDYFRTIINNSEFRIM